MADESVSETDIAWAAGLFEGEGCFSSTVLTPRGKSYRYAQASLSSTDLDVLEEFHRVVGFGKIYDRDRGASAKPHWKRCWAWQNMGRDGVVRLVTLFLPYLCDRRLVQAANVLASETSSAGPNAIDCRGTPEARKANSERSMRRVAAERAADPERFHREAQRRGHLGAAARWGTK